MRRWRLRGCRPQARPAPGPPRRRRRTRRTRAGRTQVVPATHRVVLATGELHAALTGPTGLVTRYVLRLVGDIRNLAVLYSPVKTGHLRNSITDAVHTEGARVTGTVGSAVEYSLWIHEGTAPHIIRPKTPARWVVKNGRRVRVGGVLAWGGKSAGSAPTRYATFVRHPGTKGRPFLRRAMEERLARE
jgi:hypothetical protein